MEQKDKELLLKDLSARLSYKVIVHIRYNTGQPCYGELTPIDLKWFIDSKIKEIKPYLRPMSSMTKEELYEVQKILGKGVEIQDDFISIVDSSINSFTYLELQAVFDWLNAHHFDYRGLIEKGLALEAPKDMYVAIRIIAKNKELIFKGNSNERYNFDNRRKNTQAHGWL